MFLNPFTSFHKSCLGIDIGSFSIKIVHLSRIGKNKHLKNYVKFQFPSHDESFFKVFSDKSLLLLSDKAGDILKSLLKKSGIREKKVFISIPDFSTFFPTFELPPMTKAELSKAVDFEARNHIPFSLSDVVFDWQEIKRKKEKGKIVNHKILLIAVPVKVVHQYQRLAALCNLNIRGLESEVFALVRSSVDNVEKREPICVVDIGYTTTTISIVKNGLLRVSHSFDISANDFTEAISKSLKIEWAEAEKIKSGTGMDPRDKKIFPILCPQINLISQKIDKVSQNFYQKEGEKVKKVVLTGGASCLPGLKEYFKVFLKKDVYISNPFHASNISYHPLLEDQLKKVGPSFAISLGLALRGIGK
jgi:type IV pilus assembly protein PilM